MFNWLTEEGKSTLSKGYLLENEDLSDAFKRVANASAKRISKPELAKYYYEAMANNWLCLASPVLSNMGTERGLPISCFGIDTPDSILGIGLTNAELMRLTSYGGGVGISLSRVRPTGDTIKAKGSSHGVIPWAKIYDSTIVATNQGSVRRGAASVNLDINHGDIKDFIKIRYPKGEVNRQCLNLHNCVVIDDDFMKRNEEGDPEAKQLWGEILKARFETGEPYIMYKDNVNKANPKAYVNNNLDVTMTNICSEISLFTDEDHSFICCLSSLNLARYDEWADFTFDNGMTLPELAIWFLDGVMQEFIDRSEGKKMMERTWRHATKGRALGLGVLGWHSFLQEKGLPFVSIASLGYTHKIFGFIKSEAEKASRNLASEYGEPEWCKGTGKRNTHVIAIAPTVSNSIISGGYSASIEPWPSNAYNLRSAKGVFLRKNPTLVKLLEKKGYNDDQTWDMILQESGSVMKLPNTILSPDEKEVFRTFGEINQLGLVEQAGVRQAYVDQAQSLNLSFTKDAPVSWISKVHKFAHEVGLKTLYYMRTESVLRGDVSITSDCIHCEG